MRRGGSLINPVSNLTKRQHYRHIYGIENYLSEWPLLTEAEYFEKLHGQSLIDYHKQLQREAVNGRDNTTETQVERE